MIKTHCRVHFSFVLAFPLICLLISGCGGSGKSDLEKGIVSLRNGKTGSAIKYLNRAVSSNPDSVSALSNLGVAYWKDGQNEAAAKVLEKAVSLTVDDTEPFEFLANVYMGMERWDDAYRVFEQAMEKTYRSARLLTSMALVKLSSGDAFEARVLLSEALKVDKSYTPALYNMAILYRDKALNDREAGKYFQMFLDEANDPDRVDAPVDAAYVAAARDFVGSHQEKEVVEETGNIETKVKVEAEKAQPEPDIVKKHTQLPEVKGLMEKANASIKNEDYLAALITLKSAVKVDSNDPDALWQLALLYDKHLEHGSKAAETYAEFKKRFPGDKRLETPALSSGGKVQQSLVPQSVNATVPVPGARAQKPVSAGGAKEVALALFNQGLKCQTAGDWDTAIEHYKRALEHNDKLDSAVFNMGLAYKKKNDLAEAKKCFKRSVEIDPEMIKALYMLALVHKEMKEYNDAVSVSKAALRVQPDCAKVHYLLGMVYLMTDKRDQARGCFNSCIKYTSDSSLAEKAREHLNGLP